MVAAFRGFMEEGIDRKAWAEKHFVSHRAMRGVLDIRKQLKALAASLPASSSKHLKPSAAALDNSANNTDSTTSPSIRLQPVSEISSSSSAEKSSSLLRCLLYGFPLNAALLCPDGSYRTLAGRQAVAIHPSSVLYGRIGTSRPAAIVYSEFVYTTRAYARGVSAVEREWILEALGA
jgi:ATP-dependent RNA helicase DHR2